MGRSKIAATKQQSKQRLELDAAVLGVRLSEMIESSLRIHLSSVNLGPIVQQCSPGSNLIPNEKHMYPIASRNL